MDGRRAFLMTFAIMAVVGSPPTAENWCRVGQMVIVPDGREGPVTGVNGELCQVLAYGEAYVSLWPYHQIEPAHPRFGH